MPHSVAWPVDLEVLLGVIFNFLAAVQLSWGWGLGFWSLATGSQQVALYCRDQDCLSSSILPESFFLGPHARQCGGG